MKSRDHSFTVVFAVTVLVVVAIGVFHELRRPSPEDGPSDHIAMGTFFSTVEQFAVEESLMVGLIPFENLDEVITEYLENQRDQDPIYDEMLQMWSNKVDVWGNDFQFECQPREQGYRLNVWSPGPDRVLDHSVDYDDMYLKLWVSDCSYRGN